jgi:activator of the mannose operon (transcriptional antiterminator)
MYEGKLMDRRVVSLPDQSRQALEYLLRVDQPVSTVQIASRLALSSSQIRYTFRYIEPWLNARGIRLVKKPRIGIQVEASPDQRKALMAELRSLRGYELTLTQEERRQLLLLRMLTTHAPLSSDDLCQQLGVSRTSIFRDLAWVREWLAGRDLHLTSYRHRGLIVEGAELRWRETVIELLLSNLSQGLLVAACVVPDPRTIEQSTVSPFYGRPLAS